MNLLEARELIRNFICNWIDAKCGNKGPRDMVEHMGELRFGIGNDE